LSSCLSHPDHLWPKLAKDINGLEPRLTREGYNVKVLAELLNAKPREIKEFLRGQLAPGRTPAAPHATAAPTEDLIGEELLTYEVAGDGNWFRMRFTCANGKPGSLSLPTECLHALIMTLPRMMTQALSSRYGDDSHRF
jgi:hypothetical protein